MALTLLYNEDFNATVNIDGGDTMVTLPLMRWKDLKTSQDSLSLSLFSFGKKHQDSKMA